MARKKKKVPYHLRELLFGSLEGLQIWDKLFIEFPIGKRCPNCNSFHEKLTNDALPEDLFVLTAGVRPDA